MASEQAKLSFTSADSIPMKLIRMPQAAAQLRPVHIQWIPTNKCNLKCGYCSCSNRTKSQEMNTKEALHVIDKFRGLGTKAVTITGGGEPLLHPDFSVMVGHFKNQGIEVGLVTNGLPLRDVPSRVLDLLTWCRISHADDRDTSQRYLNELSEVVTSSQKIGWAFSYVVGQTPNLSKIKRIVEFANDHKFTHVRLVGDLLCPEKIPMGIVQRYLQGIDTKVIYQPRKHYESEVSCLLGYVKPLVAPDFSMYLCCGVQYAFAEMSLDLPDQLLMGNALRLEEVYNDPQPFEVPCVRCYYRSYNEVLRALRSKIEHGEFV